MLSCDNNTPQLPIPRSSSILSTTLPAASSQNITISRDADATILPSGENASPAKIFQWLSKVSNMRSLFPVTTSQRLIAPSQSDATILLSGENASPDLQYEGPSSLRSLFPVAASQSKMVLSHDIDANILPS